MTPQEGDPWAPLRAWAALPRNPDTFDREVLERARAYREALKAAEAQRRPPPPERRLTKAEPRGPRGPNAVQRVCKLMKPQRKVR